MHLIHSECFDRPTYDALGQTIPKDTDIHTLVAWMKAEGWQIAGCPFEIYRKTGFDKLPPEEWETEIFFPVKR